MAQSTTPKSEAELKEMLGACTKADVDALSATDKENFKKMCEKHFEWRSNMSAESYIRGGMAAEHEEDVKKENDFKKWGQSVGMLQ